MPRALLILLAAIALLAAACGGSSPSGDKGDDDAASAPAATDNGTADGAVDTSTVLSSFNPFSFLESLNTASPVAAADVDPDLTEALITIDDLPGGFVALGDFTMSASTELGDVDMATTMFSSGDPAAEDFSAIGTMVMSAAIALPPEALDELGDPSQLSEITEDDLGPLQDELAATGLADLELLDASGLGDGGIGMRVSMDFGELFGALGAPADEAESAALTMEMFMFVRGERAYMVMTAWPSQQSPDVDARDLAELMDSRAA